MKKKFIIGLIIFDIFFLAVCTVIMYLVFSKNMNKSSYPVYSYNERFQQLKDFSEYAEDNVTIPFTYELYNRDKYEDFIRTYDLDTITNGKTDLDLMTTLINWVCDNFKHNGSSGLPRARDAISLVEYYQENPEGINCRGLSIILAELLRVYGIPAKHITCMPKEVEFNDCHVVVHAYSEELNQWVMLDPTYRLILKNEKGDYINLPMLRNMLLDDEKFIPNESAGWNGQEFDIDYYREYMTKNTFRFQCGTNYDFGAEDNDFKNPVNMLVPLNYEDDKARITTTSDKAFWALPK